MSARLVQLWVQRWWLIAFALCSACSATTTGPSGDGAGSGDGSKPAERADAGGSHSSGGEAGTASAGSGSNRRDGGSSGGSGGSGGKSSGMGPAAGAGGTAASGSGGSANSGSGGNAGTGGNGSVEPGASTLPSAPGSADQPKPSAGGTPNLRVLPWAGFKAAATYTFDDSQPSHVAHFAELKATGIPITWYINNSNNYIADYDATWKQALAAGHELGNHTVHHCNFDLSGCNAPLATIDLEIDECSKYITDNLGAPPVLTIAYPFGDGGYVEKSRARFLLGRGTGGGMVGPDDNTDPFNLPCMAAAGGEAATPFSGAIDDARSQGKWVIFLFHSLLPTDQNWYAGVEVANVITSIEHGKSLSDVWLDTVAHVGTYWLGARAVSHATAAAMGMGMGMKWTWELPDHFPAGSYVRVTIDGGELSQAGKPLAWDGHGYYEVALDARELSWSP